MQLWPNGLLRLGLLTTVVRAVEYDFGASYGIGPGSSSGSAKNAALKYKSVSVSGKGNGRGIDEATLRTLRRGVDLGWLRRRRSHALEEPAAVSDAAQSPDQSPHYRPRSLRESENHSLDLRAKNSPEKNIRKDTVEYENGENYY